MKILHVTKKYPNALGGDAVVVENLQKHQEADGHQVAILTSNCKSIKSGEHIYKIGLPDMPQALDHITPRRIMSLIVLFFASFYVLYKERPNVIHSHSIDMAFAVSFAARLFWIPIIHTFHIVTFYDQNQPFLRRRSEIILAKASGLRLITAPNVHDVDALHGVGLLQAAVLPNGVDMDFWQPGSDCSRPGDFTFVSVGRLEKQKGYDVLIRASAELAQQREPDFQIIIAGEGTQRARLQQLINEYNLQNAIRLVGSKNAAQVRSLLSDADAAIFSSHYETTPITLLEAWAMRLPVVTTSVGILRGVDKKATHFVYLAEANNVTSLAAAMRQCMSNAAERKKVAVAGHQEAQKYAWSDITQTAETFYASVQ